MLQSFKFVLSICTLTFLFGGMILFDSNSVNAQNNDTGIQIENSTENHDVEEEKTYILVFAHRTIGNIDNSTKIVSAIAGNNIIKIADEFVEEMSLAPNQQLEEQVDSIIDSGVNGLSCDSTLLTQEGQNVTVNCISSGNYVIWYVYP